MSTNTFFNHPEHSDHADHQSWSMRMLDSYMNAHPMCGDAVREYWVMLTSWIPEQFAKSNVAFAWNGTCQIFEFRQVRYLPPTRSSESSRNYHANAADCYTGRLTYNMHVCVDVVQTTHTYTKPQTLKVAMTTARDVPASTHAVQRDATYVCVVATVNSCTGTKCVLSHVDFQDLARAGLNQPPRTTKRSAAGRSKGRGGQRTAKSITVASRQSGLPRNPTAATFTAVFSVPDTAVMKFLRATTNKKCVCVVRFPVDGRKKPTICRAGTFSATRFASGVRGRLGRMAAVEFDDRLIRTTSVVLNVQTPLFDIPLMLGSLQLHGFGNRHVDCMSGSIIVNGLNNQIRSQLQGAVNTTRVELGKPGAACVAHAECRSLRDDRTLYSSYTLKIFFKRNSQSILCQVPNMNSAARTIANMPLEHVFAMLDVTTNVQIAALFAHAPNIRTKSIPQFEFAVAYQRALDELVWNLDMANTPDAQTLAASCYSQPMARSAQKVLCTFRNSFLPHCPTRASKIQYFVSMLRRTVRAAVWVQERELAGQPVDADTAVAAGVADNRDDAHFQQVHGSGNNMGFLVRQLVCTWVSEMHTHLVKLVRDGCAISPLHVVSYTRYGKRINVNLNARHFSTDEANQRGTLVAKLEGHNMLSTAAQSQNLTSTIKRMNKNVRLRVLRGTQFAKICFADTPEGETCSIINSQCFVAQTSRGVPLRTMCVLVSAMESVDPVDGPQLRRGWCGVFVNGHMAGMCRDPCRVAAECRQLRRAGVFPRCVSVRMERDFGCMIRCDSGRLLTPLLVAEQVHRLPRFATAFAFKRSSYDLVDALFDAGLLEFIDAHEQLETYIALTLAEVGPRHTHVLLHPSTILSATTAMAPFSNHNQAIRTLFFASQFKASMSNHDMTNPRAWSATEVLQLQHAQRPLTRTMFEEVEWTNSSELKLTGANCVVGIGSIGWNIDDATVIKKESLERGLFMYDDVHHAAIVTPHNSDIQIVLPPADTLRRKMNSRRSVDDADCYQNIGPNGLPIKGKFVRQGDVILGRIQRIYDSADAEPRVVCCSVVAKHEGFVREVVRRHNPKGIVVCVRVGKLRMPVEGDKFTNRSAQKNVVSLIMPANDMPTSIQTGVQPDIIFNGAGLISRMTISMLMEMVGSKSAAVAGKSFVDGTPYQDSRAALQTFHRDLEAAGFDGFGREPMMDGATGRRLRGEMFVGIVYVMSLKHLARPKSYARGRMGAINPRTRQTPEGRAKGGGLRMGEQEMEALIGLGSAASFAEVSCPNPHRPHICTNCKRACNPPPAPVFRTTTSSADFACSFCGKRGGVVQVKGKWISHHVLGPTLACMGTDIKYTVRAKTV